MASSSERFPAVALMPPITLEEMDGIRLMNRMDTKFVTCEDKLRDILSDALSAGYMVCEIEGSRILGYHSVYYDTCGLDMYLAHHNRRRVRQKVRVRTYLVNGVTYLEVKKKDNKGRTRKSRMEVSGDFAMDISSDGAASAFLSGNSRWTADVLSPEVSTDFSRITLVNPAKTERLTVDTGLSFHNYRNGGDASLEDAVVVELKQDTLSDSPMKHILLRHRVFPFSISKYCIGTAMTERDIKRGRFKMKIRHIGKITNHDLI